MMNASPTTEGSMETMETMPTTQAMTMNARRRRSRGNRRRSNQPASTLMSNLSILQLIVALPLVFATDLSTSPVSNKSELFTKELSFTPSENYYKEIQDGDNDAASTGGQLDPSPRIVKGTDAVQGRYPYMVALRFYGSHVCGGTLIASDIVLTAAHCMDDAPSLFFISAFIDPHDLSDPDEEAENIRVQAAEVHPSYAFEGEVRADVAVLKLVRSAKFRFPVKLNVDPDVPIDGQLEIEAIGWGDTSNGEGVYEPILQRFDDARYISNENCQGIFDFYYKDTEGIIQEDTLCMYQENGGGTCFGDSGGPLLILGDDPTQDVQVGLTSWGVDCDTKLFPGMFARISWAYEYIRTHVCEMSSDPPTSFDCDGAVTPADGLSSPPTPLPKPKSSVASAAPSTAPTTQPSASTNAAADLSNDAGAASTSQSGELNEDDSASPATYGMPVACIALSAILCMWQTIIH
eukprot:CAMPEP_0198108988 /NCGR_PEP_ID=MMETSP1442-20131203/996_1 /TAXON_ID= /ORGANISM="Craspedostauros australis, Strain CCMP3328" /LENGTH=462 /DNA_ID=CAMNT_0043764425 /DNA_START=243 /DNA_END=1631 /DNA_ORIENTATION=-